MSGMSLTALNELTALVTNKARTYRDYLLTKFAPKLEETTEKLYVNELSELGIVQNVADMQKIAADIEALGALIYAKKDEATKIADKIYEKIYAKYPKYKNSWYYSNHVENAEGILKNLKETLRSQAIAATPEVAGTVKELDNIIDNFHSQLLLASTGAEIRAFVTEMLAKIDELVKIE